MEKRKTIRYTVLAVFLVLMIAGGVLLSGQNRFEEPIPGNDKEIRYDIVVEIKGEVMFPSIYTLPDGARLADLVDLAGGFTAEADTERINMAMKLQDGTVFTIGRKNKNPDSSPNVININTASLEELKGLKGIGEAKAVAIITWREEHGGFRRIEDLMNVRGISESIFQNIKDEITV